jgi:hypothetical protein
MNLYELLGNVLTAIEPRNERALIWLDRIIFRCHEISKADLNPIARRASVQAMRFDFASFLLLQGADPKQKKLYEQANHLLEQLTVP